MRKIPAMMLFAISCAGSAHAATTTGSFTVSATVQSACSASATALAFGTYTPGSGALTNSSTISVKCTKSTPFTVALNAGATSGGSIAQRQMGSGTNRLNYNLYTSSAYNTVMGDGTAGSSAPAGVGNGVATANLITDYGQLPDSAANQLAVPGAYSDTITVTVTY